MKPSSIRLSAEIMKDYTDFFNEHKVTLSKMGIDDVSKLFRWCANEGKPIVEEKLRKIEG